ncbi:hypothetical protein DIPPA_57823 [Diplonema papillatum]|nr:hypothetical protein DIPPA_57823 [Diplonema papillatum]
MDNLGSVLPGSIEFSDTPPVMLYPHHQMGPPFSPASTTSDNSSASSVLSAPLKSCQLSKTVPTDDDTAGLLFTQQVELVKVHRGGPGAPSPRFGHTAVVHDDTMLVFGGRDARCNDELWVYDFSRHSWDLVRPDSDDKPRARAGHTAVVIGRFMYIFGGVAERSSTRAQSCWLNDLWVLNVNTYKWSLLRAKGPSLPTKRKGHTAVAHRNSMFIFGGGQDDLALNNDLWEFNQITRKWIPRRYTGHKPQERMYHVSAVNGNSMIVFGGRALTKNGFLNDLFEVNLGTFVCRELHTSGTAPTHRMCSTAMSCNGTFAVFTGGSFAYLMDSYQLDLRRMEWKLVTNVSFGGRTRPTTVRFKNTILTFGGCVEGTGFVNDYIEVQLKPMTLQQCLKQFVLEKNIELDPDEIPTCIMDFVES